MTKAYAALAGISILGLAVAAHAGAPMQLSDWQMQAITAGSANANTALQTSADGRNAAAQASVGASTAVSPLRSFAQSSTGVLTTGTGDASISTNTLNQSTANGHGPAQMATAATAGSASGDVATVQNVGITRAISASPGSSQSSMGVTESLAHTITFSASGVSH